MGVEEELQEAYILRFLCVFHGMHSLVSVSGVNLGQLWLQSDKAQTEAFDICPGQWDPTSTAQNIKMM